MGIIRAPGGGNNVSREQEIQQQRARQEQENLRRFRLFPGGGVVRRRSRRSVFETMPCTWPLASTTGAPEHSFDTICEALKHGDAGCHGLPLRAGDRLLGDHQMAVGQRRHLRRMGNREHLNLGGEAGQTLAEIKLPSRFSITVVAVRGPDDREIDMPKPDLRLEAGDILIVVGSKSAVVRFLASAGTLVAGSPLLPHTLYGPSRPPSDRIRIGLIGAKARPPRFLLEPGALPLRVLALPDRDAPTKVLLRMRLPDGSRIASASAGGSVNVPPTGISNFEYSTVCAAREVRM